MAKTPEYLYEKRLDLVDPRVLGSPLVSQTTFSKYCPRVKPSVAPKWQYLVMTMSLYTGVILGNNRSGINGDCGYESQRTC